ncbi:RRXRR domain-containing protein [Anabaena azotica]|uniref:RRXRR domain-containing protein n=1 Tax=Anabaena azotica FACHB-119 TaxID=947527 RepID=A0ABR8CZ19_9NOST|nr:RRXRR domain-containing protein [Anabaena azotica]MBD2500087.1 RRXRR domain-containing protein [Anabaena azotica FACHB-119]
MPKVLILDADRQPLYPIRISHARILLSQGKAAVFQRYPFTIILKETFSQPSLEKLGIKTTYIKEENKENVRI